MWANILLTAALLLKATHGLPKASISACTISTNVDLTEAQPLILKNNLEEFDTDAFILPEDDFGSITFARGETFQLACPGSELILDGSPTNLTVTTLMCDAGSNFFVNGNSYQFSRITCGRYPEDVLLDTGATCANGYNGVGIGFQVESRFIPLIYSCFDNVNQNVFFAEFMLTKAIGGYQKNFSQPDWKQDTIYNVGASDVGTLYSREKQRETINGLLNLTNNDYTYIQESGDYYLVSAQLAPKTDFVYDNQRRATFHYVNSAPMWETINQGNWYLADLSVRKLVQKNKINVSIFTGTMGISSLPNAANEQTDLYLYANGTTRGIPVPEMFWKYVFESESKDGAFLVTVNNPYLQTPPETICEDIGDQLDWLVWEPNNAAKGFSYVCDGEHLSQNLTFLSQLGVNGFFR